MMATESCETFASETFCSTHAILTCDINIGTWGMFLTCVSTISAFVNLMTDTIVTVDVIETSVTCASEWTISVTAHSLGNAVIHKKNGTKAFVDIFTDVVTVSWFLVKWFTIAVISTIIIYTSGVVGTFCSAICAFVNVLTCDTVISAKWPKQKVKSS